MFYKQKKNERLNNDDKGSINGIIFTWYRQMANYKQNRTFLVEHQ